MDARVERTRRRLQEALFELAQERDFDQIAVSDIAERAGINRSTFYQHYSDKELVLADALDRIAAEAGAQLDASFALADAPPPALLTFLSHVEANTHIYRQVLSGAAVGAPLARLHLHLRRSVEEIASRAAAEHADDLPAPLGIVAAAVAGSVLGAIGAWLELDDRPSAAVAAQWIWNIETSGPRPDRFPPA